jgi:hypothetical protein
VTPGEWGGPCLDDGQCTDGLECTDDSCDLDQRRCHFSAVDSRCADDVYCNGVELCAPGIGCRGGEPVACSDGTACTIDACDEATRACLHSPRDADGDGDPDGNCMGGHDCNDTDPAVSSDAVEICGNHVDDDCDGDVDESGCDAPEYDTCARTFAIDASGTFSLSAEASALDYSATCEKTTPQTRDIVASIVVPPGRGADVDVVLTTPSADGGLGMAFASRCGRASAELACASGLSSPDRTGVARLTVHSLDPGTYSLTLFTDSPPVTLSVEFRPPSAKPENETCGTAKPLSEGDHVRVPLATAATDLSTRCDGGQGELVYEFSLDAPRDVHLHATAEDAYGTPMISLRDAACGEIACREAPNDDLFRRALPAGRYFAAVSATGPSDVDIVLETFAPSAPPADESCAGAPALTSGRTQIVELAGHTDDIDTGCTIGTPDAAYLLALDRASDVLLVESFSDGDDGSVSLAAAACPTGKSLVCSSDGPSPERATMRALAKGSYRVVVESVLGLPASVTAFTRSAAPATLVPFSDSCEASPTEIPASGGLLQGNTANAADDYSASCDVGGSAGGRDQVLHLRLDEPSRVIFDARGSAYAVIVDVRRGDACPGVEITNGCSAGYVRNRSFLDLSLAEGDYWVTVDGYDGSSGAWMLDVYVGPK